MIFLISFTYFLLLLFQTKVVSSNSAHGEVYSIRDHVCQWLATGRWLCSGTPFSSTNKTDRHNITEILMKVALSTTNQPNHQTIRYHVNLLFIVDKICTKQELQYILWNQAFTEQIYMILMIW